MDAGTLSSRGRKERNIVCSTYSPYSVQFEVENSAKLHRWHQEQGVKLNEELLNIFKDKVIGFPTLMEVIV